MKMRTMRTMRVRTVIDVVIYTLLAGFVLVWAVGAILCGWWGIAIGWTEYWGRMVDRADVNSVNTVNDASV